MDNDRAVTAERAVPEHWKATAQLSRPRCIVGIDPGISGGVAFYFPEMPHLITAEDVPVVGGEVDVDTFCDRLRQMQPTEAVIERVGAMPGQGVSSTFKFGAAYGALRASLAALLIPTRLVAPTVWKKALRLGPDKEQARALAIRAWPGAGCFARKKDHNRAEAALLARWCEEAVHAGPRDKQRADQ